MINVELKTQALKSGHAVRGIGMYTRFLSEALSQRSDVTLVESSKDNQTLKPDIIHYPFFDLFFATLPFQSVAPRVVTIHDVIPLVFPKFYRPGIKGTLRLWRQQLALKKVAAIITDSEASKLDIQKYLKIKPDKIFPVYLAANPKVTQASPANVADVRKKYKLPDQFILYVGDINYNKNIPQLIKSLKSLPDEVQLVCVGQNFKPQSIPEWQWIETQLALSNVENRVRFITEVGKDSSDELAALYTAATVYVQPSLYEGFGLPVLEAMQCKTPVVSAKNSSLIEIGGDHVVFAEPTAEALAEGVKEVLGWSKTKRSEWVRSAADWASKFTWEKAAAETIKVYKFVIDSQTTSK